MIHNTSSFSLKLLELCNERCLFCFQDHETRKDKGVLPLEEGYRVIYAAFKEGYRNIQFTGGEPLLHPKIVTFMAFAKKVGFEVIGVHSNGVRFHDENFLKQCIDAGFNSMTISIHHIKSDSNDHIVGLNGGTSKSLQCIDLLSKFGICTIVCIVLNQFNYKDIYAISQYFFSKRIYQIVLMFPTIQGGMLNEQLSTMVTYNEVAPYIMKTLSLINGLHGKYIYLFNIPACVVPGFEDCIMTGANAVLRDLDATQGKYFDAKQRSNVYTEECNNCLYRKECPGIDAPYIQSYGVDSFELLSKNKNCNHTPSSLLNAITCIQGKDSKLFQINASFFLETVFSREYLLGLSVPILGYSGLELNAIIENTVLDFYKNSVNIDYTLNISNVLKYFNFGYHHIEFKINNFSNSEYGYIVWFDQDFRYEILHYILSVLDIDRSKIKTLYQVYFLFHAKKNLFHLGIDSLNKRIKLYISLYENSLEEAKATISQLNTIFNKKIDIEFDNATIQYDCVGIDITDTGIELKIYELINKDENINFQYANEIQLKEIGYMKSLQGRKKTFFRFGEKIDINFFRGEFDLSTILNIITNDLQGVFNLEGSVKYYCEEGEKKEIYFI